MPPYPREEGHSPNRVSGEMGQDHVNVFIATMKKNGYRWGARVDTPCFDKDLDSSSFDYDVKFFLNQKQIMDGGYIDKQIVAK